MKKAHWLVAVVAALALIIAGCERTPTTPLEQKQQQNPILSELNAQSQLDKAEIGDLPPGLDIRPGTPIPFWARIEPTFPNGMPEANGWGIIYFYVQNPHVIPDDFNLLNFFDPRALSANFAVMGLAGFLPGNFAPYVSVLKERDDVPFWFITSEQARAVAADHIITLPELESYHPLKGHADKFYEQLRPAGGGAPGAGLSVFASGGLDGGGQFEFKLQTRFPPGTIEARLELERD